jgi:hypothetical protein
MNAGVMAGLMLIVFGLTNLYLSSWIKKHPSWPFAKPSDTGWLARRHRRYRLLEARWLALISKAAVVIGAVRLVVAAI